MRTFLKFLIIASVVILTSSNKTVKNNLGSGLIILDLDNCKLSVNLKLSDLVVDSRLVRLETIDGAMLGHPSYYITDKYIFADNGDGLYKFSSPDGHFIKKMLTTGNGPDELPSRFHWYFYEKGNLIFIVSKNSLQIFTS